MPNYVLVCNDCDARFPEVFKTFEEREALYCTECGSADGLSNDYSTPHGLGFQLSGDNWPGKMGRLEANIVRDRLRG